MERLPLCWPYYAKQQIKAKLETRCRLYLFFHNYYMSHLKSWIFFKKKSREFLKALLLLAIQFQRIKHQFIKTKSS